jgi:hypothetical protein
LQGKEVGSVVGGEAVPVKVVSESPDKGDSAARDGEDEAGEGRAAVEGELWV